MITHTFRAHREGRGQNGKFTVYALSLRMMHKLLTLTRTSARKGAILNNTHCTTFRCTTLPACSYASDEITANGNAFN